MKFRPLFYALIITTLLFGQSIAQGWPGAMNRNAIGHRIQNIGHSGKPDNGTKETFVVTFSYPHGATTSSYAGGLVRSGWNSKDASAGEGFWVMSKTNNQPLVSTIGSLENSKDVHPFTHRVESYPEAYVGAFDHRHSALNLITPNTGQGKNGIDSALKNIFWDVFVGSSYQPALGGMPAVSAPFGNRLPAGILNYRFNRYNSGQPFSERIASNELEQLQAPSWVEALSSDDYPEMIGIQGGNSDTQNLQWTRRWFSWGHDDYNDFYIVENVVENTGTERAEGVYIVLRNRFTSAMASSWYEGAHNWMGINDRKAADNYVRFTGAPNYLDGSAPLGRDKPAGLSVGKDLAQQGHSILYAHDGDSPDIDFAHNDWGDPWVPALGKERIRTTQAWVKPGLLQHSVYFGLGVIDALPPFNTYGGLDPETYVSPHDNPDTAIDESTQQPASVSFYQFIDHQSLGYPHPRTHSDAQIYDALTTSGYPPEPDFPDERVEFMVFGPYNLEPGEKCKAIVAYVGGMGSQSLKYANYKQYARPFDFAWMNLYDGPARTASVSERQQELPAGEEAMFRHFQRAIDVYNWGYDMPNQPPNVKFNWELNKDGQTLISWSAFGQDSPDPDHTGDEAQDLRGYRIYRSHTENQGPFEFVAEFSFEDAQAGSLPIDLSFDPNATWYSNHNVPIHENVSYAATDLLAGVEVPGLYEFVDRKSRVGFPNWYSVRYYDSGHANWKGQGSVPVLESSSGPDGGAIFGGASGIVPKLPLNSVFDRLEERIKVVPNPFKIDDDLHSYRHSENIRFTNLPQRAKLEIFDVTGQKIWEDFNNDSGQAEIKWGQETFGHATGQAMFPGIYFWRVTSLMPESMGKVQKGTFVVIK